MGRVRTEMVKKLAKELFQVHHDKFSTDYEANKKAVDQFADSKTKRVRNRVAGYVTRLHVIEQRKLSGDIGEPTVPEEEESEQEPPT